MHSYHMVCAGSSNSMVGDGQWLHDEAREGNRGQIIVSTFFFFELGTIEGFLSKKVPC